METWRLLAHALPIGIGATVLLDAWAWLLQRLGSRAPDWCLVGRWVGHFPRGRFVHASIGRAAPVRGECALGWAVHYLTGIVYAAVLVAVCGSGWLRQPTLLPALVVGVGTVVFPFFVMQPGMGFGIAASKAPDPMRARLRSLATHTVFGVGLYLAARATAAMIA
ncbi:MAG TPA: DUF2938 domain-containing protein [Lysobacter sp.]|nr:DUF2938 domain-containing protein [Lysobacter sp.]